MSGDSDMAVYALVLQVPCFRVAGRPTIDLETCLVAADWHEENGTEWSESRVAHWIEGIEQFDTPADFLRSRF